MSAHSRRVASSTDIKPLNSIKPARSDPGLNIYAKFASGQLPKPRGPTTIGRSGSYVALSGEEQEPDSDKDKDRPKISLPTGLDDSAANDPTASAADQLSVVHVPRRDKAAQLLGIPHRENMEPVPGNRTSMFSVRSAPATRPPSPSHTSSYPLTSLYLVSGLPKSPATWTLADADVVQGLTHSDGAVNRWWRAEVLGSIASPGVGGGKKKKGIRGKEMEMVKGPGALTKQETAKMLSKSLKLSFTREVEIIASTLQPASTVHTFTFTLPAQPSALGPPPSTLNLTNIRSSVFSATTDNVRYSNALSNYGDPYPSPYPFDLPRPSSAYVGQPSVPPLSVPLEASNHSLAGAGAESRGAGSVTYHGICLTVWSHADSERSAAIRRTLESKSHRARKHSAQSLVASRLKSLRSDITAGSVPGDPTKSVQKKGKKVPWVSTDAETDVDSDGDGEGAISESEYEVASTVGHNVSHNNGPGESTLFLPGDSVFWLPYALTLVSRYPIYDLMRDYLTLSWARFSKDVASHTLQISKILAHPTPRAGDVVRLDASPKEASGKSDGALEVLARFPGGLDFGRGLVDINFTMWPLFKCLNIDNILTICEIALAPTGRVLFFSRHPVMLGIAVATIKYIAELRGWNGFALPAVHSRDAKIYVEDPGPWIIGLATELRYAVRPSPEVCVVDLDINYLNCPSPPPNCLSGKQQRDKYRVRLLSAFGDYYHPDHSVPIEFKEAFPAGRFRPICKIQAKRGNSATIIAEALKAPDWWNSTKIIQAFDVVLEDKYKRPSLLKRISTLRLYKRPPRLTVAEQQIQLSIRKRTAAFVDARDDLETKIGRLSRRLNFLMTESDLWRDKFVTFEQYAEKLSDEANDLRTKISKEQKESKRLTGLISLTAAEKIGLQTQLHTTESAHKNAVHELEKMRVQMEKMEEERTQMMAEVEAQIESALASMGMDLVDSDMDSHHGSERSVGSRSRSMSRRPSAASGSGRTFPPMRSFSTESTLAETVAEGTPYLNDSVIEEEAEESATMEDMKGKYQSPDAMAAVDEGIEDNSGRIAQKVMQIQQKLENALASDIPRRSYDSQSEATETGYERPTIVTHRTGHRQRPLTSESVRTRSSTVSSSQTAHAESITTFRRSQLNSLDVSEHDTVHGHNDGNLSDDRRSLTDYSSPPTSSTISSNFAPWTPARTNAITEDSDTDFQSAYSTSPRDSYVDSQDEKDSLDHYTDSRLVDLPEIN